MGLETMQLLIKLREANNKIAKLEDERRIILDEKNALEIRVKILRSYLNSFYGKMVFSCERNILVERLAALKTLIIGVLGFEGTPEELISLVDTTVDFIDNLINEVTKNAE